jgi:predicted O-linked N-acetylglucosamine transferase (SPINDLY family)
MRDRLCAYADAVNPDVVLKESSLDCKAKEKIKIGVVTSHLGQHSVFSVVIRGILSNLNRDYFSVYLYCTDAKKVEDKIIRDLALDGYISVLGYSQRRYLEDKILSDDLDALWYPEIGMNPLTSWLAIKRLAPVQFASWGHPITTGFKSIDYFLSGELIEGANSKSHYSERLVKLPGTGCITAFEKNTPKMSSWEREQFPKNKLTFLMPQNPFKFHPMNDDLIIQIARLFPDAKFLVPQNKNFPNSVKQILGRIEDKFGFSEKSSETQFITFPWMKSDEFLSLMETVDIYLDLPSFSGYTTAWQGVNCGIPIVTFEGEFMRQRLASGLLRKIGIIDTIAQSFEGYVSIVQRLAKLREQPEQWHEYRQKIKNSAPKADNDLTVVRSFEQFLFKALSYGFAPVHNRTTQSP